MTGSDLEPCYFDSPDGHALFGCFHPPREGQGSRWGVVTCYPQGHEYTAAHRAFRLLAARLARQGVPVLRFDYRGCGDSEGDSGLGSVRGWLEDTRGAIAELERRSGCTTVRLVGLRLGAALAVLLGAGHERVGAVVAWDPVVNGERYVADLRRLHAEHSEYAGGDAEILGYPLDDALREELQRLDLLGIERAPGERVLIVETGEPRPGAEALAAHIRGLGAHCDHEHMPAAGRLLEQVDKVSVPGKLIERVATWLSSSP